MNMAQMDSRIHPATTITSKGSTHHQRQRSTRRYGVDQRRQRRTTTLASW
jgi:hypothetical protein